MALNECYAGQNNPPFLERVAMLGRLICHTTRELEPDDRHFYEVAISDRKRIGELRLSVVGRTWNTLLTWFWIRRFDQLVEERPRFVFRLLRWYARIFMGFYLVAFPMLILMSLIELNIPGVIGAIVGLVLFPIAFRFVMGLLTTFWV